MVLWCPESQVLTVAQQALALAASLTSFCMKVLSASSEMQAWVRRGLLGQTELSGSWALRSTPRNQTDSVFAI